MVAAYLIGEHGRWYHAVVLGVIVTITHTSVVYLLVGAHIALANSPGLRAALGLSTDAALTLSYWLGFVAAVGIVFLGAYLLTSRLRRGGIVVHGHSHEHNHDHEHAHAHGHEHAHAHDHAHSHEHAHQHAVAAPDAKVCPRCGQENGSTAAECGRCGRALRDPPYPGAFSHRLAIRDDGPPDEPAGRPACPGAASAPAAARAEAAGAADDVWAEHGHSHAPPPGWSLSTWSLIMLGVTGGMLPCPSALLTALGAISVETRLGAEMEGGLPAGVVALLLVVAFSVGLAGALTAVGLIVVAGKAFARRLFADPCSRASRLALFYLPVASAIAVTALGSLLSIDLFCRATARPSPLDAIFNWTPAGGA
jgi:ABC-type nickel/cobalt efflux system permease component RcnA